MANMITQRLITWTNLGLISLVGIIIVFAITYPYRSFQNAEMNVNGIVQEKRELDEWLPITDNHEVIYTYQVDEQLYTAKIRVSESLHRSYNIGDQINIRLNPEAPNESYWEEHEISNFRRSISRLIITFVTVAIFRFGVLSRIQRNLSEANL